VAGTKVDFYVLSASDRRSRLTTVCRLVEKAYEQGLRVAVRTSAPIFAAEEVIQESAIEFEHEVEDTEEVVDKFKKFLDEVTPEDFAQGAG